jgi:hypothetical protein
METDAREDAFGARLRERKAEEAPASDQEVNESTIVLEGFDAMCGEGRGGA